MSIQISFGIDGYQAKRPERRGSVQNLSPNQQIYIFSRDNTTSVPSTSNLMYQYQNIFQIDKNQAIANENIKIIKNLDFSNLSTNDIEAITEIVTETMELVEGVGQEEISAFSLATVEYLYQKHDISEELRGSFIAQPLENLIGNLINYYKSEEIKDGTFWDRTQKILESLVKRILDITQDLEIMLSGGGYTHSREDIYAVIDSWEELISVPELKKYYKSFVNESIVAFCMDFSTQETKEGEDELPKELIGALGSFLAGLGSEVLTETQMKVLYEEYENGNYVYIAQTVQNLIVQHPELLNNQEENFATALEKVLESIEREYPNFLEKNLAEDFSIILGSPYTTRALGEVGELMYDNGKWYEKAGNVYNTVSAVGGIINEEPRIALDLSAVAYEEVERKVEERTAVSKPCSRGFYFGHDLLSEVSGSFAAVGTYAALSATRVVNYADRVSTEAHYVVTGKKNLLDVCNEEYTRTKKRNVEKVTKCIGDNWICRGVADFYGSAVGTVNAVATTTLTAGTAAVEDICNCVEDGWYALSSWVSSW